MEEVVIALSNDGMENILDGQNKLYTELSQSMASLPPPANFIESDIKREKPKRNVYSFSFPGLRFVDRWTGTITKNSYYFKICLKSCFLKIQTFE